MWNVRNKCHTCCTTRSQLGALQSPRICLATFIHIPAALVALASPQAKQDASALQEQTKELKARIKEAEELEGRLSAERDAAVLPMGNLVHDTVPIFQDEVGGVCWVLGGAGAGCWVLGGWTGGAGVAASGAVRRKDRHRTHAPERNRGNPSLPPSHPPLQAHNVVVKTFGEDRLRRGEKLWNHVDLVALLDIADLAAGTAVAGAPALAVACCAGLRRAAGCMHVCMRQMCSE